MGEKDTLNERKPRAGVLSLAVISSSFLLFFYYMLGVRASSLTRRRRAREQFVRVLRAWGERGDREGIWNNIWEIISVLHTRKPPSSGSSHL